MEEWRTVDWLNMFFAVWCAILAKGSFEDENNGLGWLNLFASSLNTSLIATKFL